jgi:hypothetical protein
VTFADNVMALRLTAAGYVPDPTLNRHTVIPIRDIHDLQYVPQQVPHPVGNNTIWRWNDVFPAGQRPA